MHSDVSSLSLVGHWLLALGQQRSHQLHHLPSWPAAVLSSKSMGVSASKFWWMQCASVQVEELCDSIAHCMVNGSTFPMNISAYYVTH